MKKRITALFLLVCMLLTLLPVGTLADVDEEGQTPTPAVEPAQPQNGGGSGTGGTGGGTGNTGGSTGGTGSSGGSASTGGTGSAGGGTGNTGGSAGGTGSSGGSASTGGTGSTGRTSTGESGSAGSGTGGTGGETHTHNWGAWTDAGNGQHTRKCSGCEETEIKEHGWGNWIADGENHVRTCADCGAKDAAQSHSYSTDFKSNGDGTHSKVCSVCGAKTETATCTEGTAATCKEAAKCGVCQGAIGQPSDEHEGEVTYASKGDGTHTGTYSICGHTFVEPCTAEKEADCTHKAVCEKCKTEFGDVKHKEAKLPQHLEDTETHRYYCEVCNAELRVEPCQKKAVSNKDGTHKIICSVCNMVLESGVPCTPDSAQDECGKQRICAECGGPFGDPLRHDLDANDVCKRIATGKCHCKTNHQGLWTAGNADRNTLKCPECGATVGKRKISAAFKVSNYKLGGNISSLKVTSSSEYVTAGKPTGVTPADGKFKPGTEYAVTVPYTAAPGYIVEAITIGGREAHLADGTATATLPVIGTECTVTFNTQGHGKAPEDQKVKYNNTARQPAAPTEKGYAFCGWYTDKECKSRFSFSTPITGDTTLYALWKDAYTLKFATNRGKAISAINVPEGDTVNLKDYKPTRSGYSFSGWYKTEDLKGKQITSIAMTAENVDKDGVAVVYAKWKKVDTTNPKTGDTIGLAVGVLTLTTVLGAAAVVTKKKRTW